jgi:hypothetical protein
MLYFDIFLLMNYFTEKCCWNEKIAHCGYTSGPEENDFFSSMKKKNEEKTAYPGLPG